MRTKAYDPASNRLLYFDREASSDFWDDKWQKSAAATFANPPRHGQTVSVTRKYLPEGSRILEGGCGIGDVVHALVKAGYQAYGVDYAPRIIEAINQNWPHLDVRQGDVRSLPWEDGFFDGYWSFGVIEHFLDGYDPIAHEMHRVLKRGGYLFLTFPAFNPYRKRRAAAGKYSRLAEFEHAMPLFYQFALDPQSVMNNFERIGFSLVEQRGTNALVGLADELQPAAAIQQLLERLHPRAAPAVSMVMDRLAGRFIGHSSLLVLRKNS